MTDFLIKSSVTMVLLLGLYHLFLEREKMHRFNRFYLLFALAFSLALPFITFTVYKQVAGVQDNVATAQMSMQQLTVMPVEESVSYMPYLLMAIYMSITLVLLFRFVNNLLHFKKAIRSNKTVIHKNAVLILLNDKILPHTFLHYIFINKQEYENRLIEDELFTHELTHVNQKHTLDILFIEALLTVFWFNPLLYFYKKAIKLNHEFLADEAVVSQTHNVINYQQLLLQKAVPATQYYLASSLNFSVTKKRFTMMTKDTPKGKATVLRFIALPVIAALVFTLCIQTVAQTKVQPVAEKAFSEKDSDRDTYFEGVRVRVLNSDKVKILYKPYEQFTEAEKDKYLPPVPEPMKKMPPTAKEFEALKKAKKCVVFIDSKNVSNKELGKYNAEDFAVYADLTAYGKELKIPGYLLLTNAYYEKEVKNENSQYKFETYTAIMLEDDKTGKLQPVMLPEHMGTKEFLKQREKLKAAKNGKPALARNSISKNSKI
ncbi:M56 family metallopeptidase [Flavobacterium rivuli]|uniref:M56 family metallopeptidase n=1 Tax=Flavobacterium rivuli TaxID=498301 RepID=UPI00037DEDA1|nr:M56 family metallopeptidase [Flavobacterium rivuli]